MQRLLHNLSMSRAQVGVVVWLHEPLWGMDPDNGEMFKSNRHILYATRVVQDPIGTAFLDDDGVVLGEWNTSDIARFEWREPEPSSGQREPEVARAKPEMFPVGSVEWRADVKSRYPKAYLAWSPSEDDQLREEFNRGDAISSMVLSHQRQPGGIRSRLVKLGLIDGPEGRAT